MTQNPKMFDCGIGSLGYWGSMGGPSGSFCTFLFLGARFLLLGGIVVKFARMKPTCQWAGRRSASSVSIQ